MKVIIPLGPPNTGKGTRESEVVEAFGDQYEILSGGNMLRAEVAKQTELGEAVKAYMDAGALVPDNLIVEMFLRKIRMSTKNVFLDGFPRTVGQAEAMLEAGIRPDLVINLQVEEEVVLQRARDRIVCTTCGESYTKIDPFKHPKVQGICDKCGGELQQRNDDLDEEVVRKRLRVYEEQTKPVLEFLENAGIKVCAINNSSPTASEDFKKLVTQN